MKRKKLFIFLSVVLIIVIFFGVINIIPPKKSMEDNPFIISEGDDVMIAAHRGGKNLNPENTFKAFNYSIANYDIDIIELDLCLTSDNYLVLSHDLTINDYTDVEEEMGKDADYFVSEHTLAELQVFNFGYKFCDSEGNYPYKDLLEGVSTENKATVLYDNDLRIVTVDELFSAYEDTELLFIMEIKDSGDAGLRATDNLVSLLKKYNMEKRVVVGTFHDEVESYLKSDYPTVMRGASVGAATSFIITQMLKINIFDQTNFACLQVPTSQTAKGININLAKKTYIDRAHKRNISVQYWTINDKEEMRKLILLGADVIMTDNPDILYDLIQEMKDNNEI